MEEIVKNIDNNLSDAETLKLTIGKNIAEYRKLAKLSQIEFAEKLNYSDKAISKWERGESIPDVLTLVQLAELFEISVNALLGNTEPVLPQQPLQKLRLLLSPQQAQTIFSSQKIFCLFVSTTCSPLFCKIY